jgi:DNA-binding response OmpR family regulator
MKILIAEDESVVLKMMELSLKKIGYEVICCKDGLETMEKVQLDNPDVIVVDIMLPYFSGLEIAGKLRQNGNTVPIIVISALGQQTVVDEALKLGANDYIAKPFNINVLNAKIKEHTGEAASVLN